MRLHLRDIQRDIWKLGAMLGDTIERIQQQSIDRRDADADIARCDRSSRASKPNEHSSSLARSPSISS